MRIDPLILARVKDLPLVAKTVAQGFLHGLHHSTQKGSGIEFSQYRGYEPGDELGKVDWKLFARCDRYFVREAERESNINVWLVCDASDSMLQISEHSKKQGGWNKLDYARHLLATIGYIAHQQGDGIGFLGLSTEKVDYRPALSGQQHWQKLQIQLAQLKTGKVFPELKPLQALQNNMGHNGLIFLVSDFYQKNNEIIEFISSLKTSKTDVVAVQLESKDEIDFPYRGLIRFEDLESKQHLLISAQQAKSHYLSARETFNQRLSQQLNQLQIQHLRTSIDQSLDQTLYAFLSARQKVG